MTSTVGGKVRLYVCAQDEMVEAPIAIRRLNFLLISCVSRVPIGAFMAHISSEL